MVFTDVAISVWHLLLYGKQGNQARLPARAARRNLHASIAPFVLEHIAKV